MTLKWIAAQLHMGTWTNVSNLLSAHRQTATGNEPELDLIAVKSED